MHMCTWMCVFLGFGPSTQNTVLGSLWLGPADSGTCAQTIGFEKLAESVAEVVQRSKSKKEKAHSQVIRSPIVTKVCETQLGDGSFSASAPVRPWPLVYNLNSRFHSGSLG